MTRDGRGGRGLWRGGLWSMGVACCLLLGGCGSLMQRFMPHDDGAQAGAAADSGDDLARKTPPTADEHAVYRLEVDTPSPPLTKLLTDYLDLSRFQNLKAADTITTAELDRLESAAPAQARTLLQTEGYFNARVDVSREEAPAGAPVNLAESQGQEQERAQDRAGVAAKPPLPSTLIRVHVEPGPRTRVTKVDVTASGPLQDAAARGDALATRTLASLRSDWTLEPGQPFRQADWATAKSNDIAQLRANGYASATWAASAAAVDAEANTASLSLTADSGPLFHVGELRIEGVERYDPNVIRNLAGFSPGAPYSEKLLLDYQARLTKVGLFGGVVVEIDPDPAKAAATPVTVRVTELSLFQTTIGAGFSTDTGPRVTLQHLDRNLFGTNWQATNNFSYGQDLKSWQGQVESNPRPDQWRDLVAAGAENLISGDDTRDTISARIGRTRESERMDRLYFFELLRTDVKTSLTSTKADAAWANYSWVSRHLDSILLPSRGTALSLQLGAGIGRGDGETPGPFGRALSRLTYYRPFGNGWFGQARIEGGQVLAGDSTGIPDTLLFRAGGEDSVRGYAYRALGPNVNGAIVSGKVLMTSSLEVAHPIIASLPTLWGAVFIDAGNAAMSWGQLKPAVGYGVGLRLRSPVGPLRIDLAYGERVRQFRLHLSVGVTF